MTTTVNARQAPSRPLRVLVIVIASLVVVLLLPAISSPRQAASPQVTSNAAASTESLPIRTSESDQAAAVDPQVVARMSPEVAANAGVQGTCTESRPAVWCSEEVAGSSAARPQLSVGQVHAAFANAYRTDPISTWDWTSPPVNSFTVRDTVGDRVLMVLVYPSAAAADLARQQAAARSANDISSPHLVPGYGPSVWSGNVALVQSTASQLASFAQVQADRDNGVYVDPALVADPSAPAFVVDLDFQQALQRSVFNL